TESANLALFGTVGAWRRSHHKEVPHIIVSTIEHDAVLESARKLEAEGVRVTWLPVDRRGVVDLGVLKDALTENTVLVSVMYANNEIGTIQPVRDIAKVIRKWKKEHRQMTRDRKVEGDERCPLFHTDAVQAANYCDMSIPRLGVDMLTMNAAKIYGPKGVGLLALLRGTPLEPLLVGGGHEDGRRAGTENVPAIVGFAEALRIAQEMSKKESKRLVTLRDYAIGELRKIRGIQGPTLRINPQGRTLYSGPSINGDEVVRLPNNVNFSLPGIDHEFLALQLDAKGFAVATKSACNETDAETSHVLAALREADGTDLPQSGIRLSFGRSTTKKDVGAFLSVFRDRVKFAANVNRKI
ncbi:MAG TPA: cysteine desulfurase family protein, partial [Candidatus Paceibacterota bacterium]|nr:cysteine desulfurase family protein [Candidatus Paceibacterota bacterium]